MPTRTNTPRRRATKAPSTKRQPAQSRTSRAAAGAPATFIPPMKALSVASVPEGDWKFEVKLDGYRAIAVINGDDVELWSRNHKPLSEYPAIEDALRGLGCANAVIDGEIVALDPQGRSRFQLLQQRGLTSARPPIVYYVFDLLHEDGRSLIPLPLEERQAALQALVGKGGNVLRVSPVFETSAEQLLAEVSKQGLEGIIAKEAGSSYEPDRRSGRWLKCKVHGEQEFVIGGFTPPKNSRPHFGAILVGYFANGEFRYAGKVGSGFDHALLGSLHREFERRRVESCPFVDLPTKRASRFGGGMTRGAMRSVTWVKPELVCQVRFTEWTEDGMLRHPVFLGLRTDKEAREVVRETTR